MRYGIVTANLGDYADPRVAVRLARAALGPSSYKQSAPSSHPLIGGAVAS